MTVLLTHMGSLAREESCGEKSQLPRRARTDSWLPYLEESPLPRRSIAIVVDSVVQAVAPSVCAQLEASLRSLLSEHAVELSRIQATLEGVEQCLVSRYKKRGSAKSESRRAYTCDLPSPKERRRDSNDCSPPRSRNPSRDPSPCCSRHESEPRDVMLSLNSALNSRRSSEAVATNLTPSRAGSKSNCSISLSPAADECPTLLQPPGLERGRRRSSSPSVNSNPPSVTSGQQGSTTASKSEARTADLSTDGTRRENSPKASFSRDTAASPEASFKPCRSEPIRSGSKSTPLMIRPDAKAANVHQVHGLSLAPDVQHGPTIATDVCDPNEVLVDRGCEEEEQADVQSSGRKAMGLKVDTKVDMGTRGRSKPKETSPPRGQSPKPPSSPTSAKRREFRKKGRARTHNIDGDASFRSRFFTAPVYGTEEDEEIPPTPKTPADNKESSLMRSLTHRSKSPERDKHEKYGDHDRYNSNHHFDLYSLEQLHSSRLLELEVEATKSRVDDHEHGELVGRRGSENTWCAISSMMPMQQEDIHDKQHSSPKVVPAITDKSESSTSKHLAVSTRDQRRPSGISTSNESMLSGSALTSDFTETTEIDNRNSTRNLDDLRRRHDHKLTVSELRHEDDTYITSPEQSEHGSNHGMEDNLDALQWKTRIALCICGVVPWQLPKRFPFLKFKAPTWYQNLVLLIAVMAAACTTFQGLLGKALLSEDDKHRSFEWRWYLGTLPYSIGSIIGLVIVRAGRVQKLVRSFPGPLEAYALRHGFVDMLSRETSRRLTVLISFWTVVVLVRLTGDILLLEGVETAWDTILLIVCFTISSGILLALVSVQLYIFTILGMMVDQFCFKFVDNPDVSHGIQEWNVIQAILRHVAKAFDWCFLATQTMALTALLLSATQLLQVDLQGGTRRTMGYISGVFLPPVLMACGAGSLFFIAAEVTEKCNRVPALLNSVMCGSGDMEQHDQRNCLVNYVTHSAAGFYMKEVRLTSSMALKLTYITFLGAYFVVTQLASKSSDRNNG